jgi:hypothetical protein
MRASTWPFFTTLLKSTLTSVTGRIWELTSTLTSGESWPVVFTACTMSPRTTGAMV